MNGETKSVHAAAATRELLRFGFVTFGRITVSLPLGALIFCFFSAIIFQFEAVNETVCNVRNTVPSISAITGVTPQRYIWRVCVALHCAPRFAIGFIYWYYFIQRAIYIAPSQVFLYQWLVRIAFWLYIIENSCLVGVTYVANVENYPFHEKMFIGFMVSSIVYELVMLIIFRWCHPQMKSQPVIASSYKIKKVCFVVILLCTAGLVYNFFRHRWYCEPGAFTLFSAFEYGIAIANMAFHFTATKEFQHMKWTFGSTMNQPLDQPTNNHHKLN